MEKTVCYIGLGSNIGDLKKNLWQAIKEIHLIPDTQIHKISSFHKTKPYGYKDQEDFLNAVLEIVTDLSAEKLLEVLQFIELKMGRVKNFVNGPRVIDIDILFYGDNVFITDQLVIPHHDIDKRNFVLLPMVEIVPDFIHPVLNQSMRELLDILGTFMQE
ncbi:MAG: 2-amino-4-hydroxy-6-hydroxymethyldihydropteridine diphosphokinase [Candidatus Cloacimonetes bacterium]|nr:2-amino-4-hydroxy-6-hydroxymethyldihydropteridine diphosphokinase [Candidatus Cloacimonadota bacterium]